MSKLNMNMSSEDALVALSEGNPGAIQVLMGMLTKGPSIDPDAGDPILTVLSLDMDEIYGSRIYVLFKYVCKKDLTLVFAALRSVQLGIATAKSLQEAIGDENGQGFDDTARIFFQNEALAKVQEELPRFGRPAEEAAGIPTA